MGEYRNPFTPTFGMVPPFMAGRTYIIDDILRALDRGPGDPNLSTIFIGARGTGKTALLSYLSSEAGSHGWIAVSVAAAPGMLEDIYERTKEAAAEFIDRFLVTCEAYKVPVTILLAKTDLARTTPDAMAAFHDTYEHAGYRVIDVSATEGAGVDEVRELLRGRTTLLSGNSGVGKSTLVAAVERTAEVRTGEISRSHRKGRHTTTFSTMYPLSEGGYIIDTPGIKGFGLIDIGDAELARYFPEMMRWLPECRFYNCSHTHEPHCAVIEAVKRGDIALSRYESYLKILDEDDKYRK